MTNANVCFRTEYDDDAFHAACAKSWIDAAQYYYRRFYNFDEHTPKERKLLTAWRRTLQRTLPKEYKQGIHQIGTGCCFMGEDLFVVDGQLQHSMHLTCARCDTARVIRYQNQTWCVSCEKEYSA